MVSVSEADTHVHIWTVSVPYAGCESLRCVHMISVSGPLEYTDCVAEGPPLTGDARLLSIPRYLSRVVPLAELIRFGPVCPFS
jgi:hypothetical protein